MSRLLGRARRGFTLIEVTFVVVVGLIILSGVITAYHANKSQAGGATARQRVHLAQAVIEEFQAQTGSPPASGSGQFPTMWVARYPDHATRSPWGGTTADLTTGVSEDAPYTDGTTDPATAPDKTATRTLDGTRSSNLHYTSISQGRYVKVLELYTGDSQPLKSYVLSIYDTTGNPWFEVAGGAR